MGKEKVDMRGRKVCPKCNEVNGARSVVCKKCGEAFPVKPKADTKQKTVGIALDGQLDAIKSLGGLDALRQHIANLDAAQKALEPFGGPDRAYEVLRLVEKVAELTEVKRGKK